MSAAMESRWKRRTMAENNEINARKREHEALRLVRGPRTAHAISASKIPTRLDVRRWMRTNASEYETATELAEAASVELCLPQDWIEEESHWVWDEAVLAHDI